MFLYINLACYWLEAFSDLLPQIEKPIFVESYMYAALLAVKSRTVWGNAFVALVLWSVNIALCNLLRHHQASKMHEYDIPMHCWCWY